jgi:hypothetical protein
MATKHEIESGTIEHAYPTGVQALDAKIPVGEVDDALRLVIEGEDITWTAAEERKVLWKTDSVILSLVSDSTKTPLLTA